MEAEALYLILFRTVKRLEECIQANMYNVMHDREVSDVGLILLPLPSFPVTSPLYLSNKGTKILQKYLRPDPRTMCICTTCRFGIPKVFA